VNPAVRRWAYRLSHPWLAITLLVLIFIHQAVGSAGFAFRQSLEVSEMAWFNGPLSIALWTVLCLCLTLASLVRIPWCWSRAGTHLTHASVVALTVTTIIYFANKVEGEALLLRHFIEVRTAQGSARLLPDPGSSALLGDASASVEAIMPTWTIRSSDGATGESQQVWAAMVKVTFPDAHPFTVTVLEGHPELTQYTMEGRTPKSWWAAFSAVVARDGRIHAVNAAGQDVLDTAISVGAKTTAGAESLEVTGITQDWPLLAEGFQGRKGTMVAWTLRGEGGMTSGSSIIGEPTLTRFQRARIKQCPDPRLQAVSLVPATTAIAYRVDQPALWVRTADHQPDAAAPLRSGGTPLPIKGLPRYQDYGTHIGGQPLAIDLGSAENVRFTVTGFAPYATMESVWREDPTAPARPMLDLEVASDLSGQQFSIPVPFASDVTAIDETPIVWLSGADSATAAAIHERLLTRFPAVEADQETLTDQEAGQTRLVFVQGADRRFTLWVGEVGRSLKQHPLTIGGSLAIRWSSDQIKLRLRQVIEHPRAIDMPVPVPTAERRSRSSVGDFMSFIQINAATAGNPAGVNVWVPYTPFPHLPAIRGDSNGTLASFSPRPVTVTVPGGPTLEVEYAREPFALPRKLWMTGVSVPRRPGSEDPSEFFCSVAHADSDGSGVPTTGVIHMNHPLAWQEWFLFQAQWDPPHQALSVLGVGNRPVGGWMLAASISLAIGIAWSGLAAALRRNT